MTVNEPWFIKCKPRPNIFKNGCTVLFLTIYWIDCTFIVTVIQSGQNDFIPIRQSADYDFIFISDIIIAIAPWNIYLSDSVFTIDYCVTVNWINYKLFNDWFDIVAYSNSNKRGLTASHYLIFWSHSEGADRRTTGITWIGNKLPLFNRKFFFCWKQCNPGTLFFSYCWLWDNPQFSGMNLSRCAIDCE